jgi:VWFA-related protein
MTTLPIALAIALAAAPLAAKDVPSFQSGVQSVYVDVFVSDRGVSVRGLGAKDFEVRDDGHPQDARLIDAATMPLSTVLVFDVSGSIDGGRAEDLRRAANAFVRGLKPADTVRLLSFAQSLDPRSFAPLDAATLAADLARLHTGGRTSLYDAVYVALKGSEAASVRPVLVVFSDGEDNASWLTSDQLLKVVKDSNALIYVAATAEPKKRASEWSQSLDRIAAATGGSVIRVDSTARLEEAFTGVLEDLSARYLLAYEPAGRPRAGMHKLEVRLKAGKGKVRARNSYLVD